MILKRLLRSGCRIFHTISLSILLIFFPGCGKKEESHDHDVAKQLFEKSVRMISVYIDSVNNASDSAALKSIVKNFNVKITRLNFEFPPETDLELNEDENDSLIRMHKHFIRAINLRDSVLAHPVDSLKLVVDKDSIKSGESSRLLSKTAF